LTSINLLPAQVFVGYAMMAHLIFGNAIEKFQTFGDSVNTCFEILLGNIDVNNDLRALGGLQSVAGALFFVSPTSTLLCITHFQMHIWPVQNVSLGPHPHHCCHALAVVL
jgi:hypothetical protein